MEKPPENLVGQSNSIMGVTGNYSGFMDSNWFRYVND